MRSNPAPSGKGGLSDRTRKILIAVACVLACAVIVLAIVLIVPHDSAAERQEYPSIEAYNEEHGTDYLCPVYPEQTADLYTDRQTYLYRSGWYDLLLQLHFNYSDHGCDFYIQPDKDDDLAAREGFAFLAPYGDLDRSQYVSFSTSSAPTEFRYRELSGSFYTRVETEDVVYYLCVQTDNKDLFFTVVSTVFYDLIDN